MFTNRSDEPKMSFVTWRCQVLENARAQCDRGVVASLLVVLMLALRNDIAASAAQELVEQHQLKLTVLTSEQEKERAAAPGSEFRECASHCPLMIVLPPGKFMMGSLERDPEHRSSEGPQHAVTIGVPFAVSKFELTFEEWDVCVAASACVKAADEWGRGRMPVINVSWDEAQLYVHWLPRATGKPYRLLTEAEWEYAVRAGSTTRLSWGVEPGANNANNANCSDCGGKWHLQTAPVGSFEPNALGLYDMHGNVWEWVEDVWHENYEGGPTDGSAWLKGENQDYRVIRGGSWHNESELIGTAIRFKRNRHVRFDTLGFRVARTMTP